MNSISLKGIDSVAIFGSLARGDFDALSDYDIFLVSDNLSFLRKASVILEKVGWSCTAYSWRQMSRTVNRRTLFLQHLKQEAIILQDRNGRLRDTLNSFCPKCDYLNEILEAEKLLSVLSDIPDCIEGKLWALDVLMVGFRSVAVATLANTGRYCFSFVSLLKTLRSLNILQCRDIDALLRLRRFKRDFRHGYYSQIVSWPEIFRIIDIVDSRFKIGLDVRRSPSWKVFDSAMKENAAYSQNWYISSRRVESAVLCLHPVPSKQYTRHKEKKGGLLHRVSSPSQYGWYFGYCFDDVKRDLLTLANDSIIS